MTKTILSFLFIFSLSLGAQAKTGKTKNVQRQVASAPFCGAGKQLVAGEFKSDGCQGPPSCISETNCPVYSPPLCEGGNIVVTGRDANGCAKGPICVKSEQCPIYSPPLCEGGKIVDTTGYEANGCPRPPACVMPNQCPEY
jgi:hypothetical protein